VDTVEVVPEASAEAVEAVFTIVQKMMAWAMAAVALAERAI
jgi:hypothetical protein